MERVDVVGAAAPFPLTGTFRRRQVLRRRVALAAVAAITIANLGLLTWLWVAGGNLDHGDAGDVLTAIGRLTGLWSAYLALVQVLLLARLPLLERAVGFDRLSIWHRWNGHATLDLVVAHVVFTILGYAALDRLSIPAETTSMISSYPGMITAWLGTALIVAVVASSIVIVRRRMRYEWWYAVHLTAYVGIALAWFHQIPTGNELVLRPVVDAYWKALYVVTFALLVGCRVLVPLVNAFRYRMRVTDVVQEGPGVVSLRIEGRGLDRLRARAGQFFLWRFLSRGRWWASHPFSLSATPTGDSLRITVKDLGDFSGRLACVAPGTRVVAEGPFGVFTDRTRRRDKVLLVGGGIGITPIRALLDEMPGDVVAVHRVLTDDDAIFRDELAGDPRVHVVAGDHATTEGARLLAPDHLRELVPDLAEREVYVCGPPAMADAVARNVRAAGVPRRFVHVERFAL
jgi:predicted ferric reductase